MADRTNNVMSNLSDAAAAATSAIAALSATHNTSATASNITLTVLQRVLSSCSASERAAAVAQLPCLTSQLSQPKGVGNASDTFGSLVAAAAAAVLSFTAHLPPATTMHPLITASCMVSAAASRVGDFPAFFQTPNHFDYCVTPTFQALTSPSSKCCRPCRALTNRVPPFTNSGESIHPPTTARRHCVSSALQQLLPRVAVAALLRRSAACCSPRSH
jgi:hypothetical protein